MAKRLIYKVEMAPYSSVVGQLITLFGKRGQVVGGLSIRPGPDGDPKENAERIANEVVAAMRFAGAWD